MVFTQLVKLSLRLSPVISWPLLDLHILPMIKTFSDSLGYTRVPHPMGIVYFAVAFRPLFGGHSAS